MVTVSPNQTIIFIFIITCIESNKIVQTYTNKIFDLMNRSK